MFQRVDKLRKNAFASMCVFGEDKANNISGIWVWRGQELAFPVSILFIRLKSVDAIYGLILIVKSCFHQFVATLIQVCLSQRVQNQTFNSDPNFSSVMTGPSTTSPTTGRSWTHSRRRPRS